MRSLRGQLARRQNAFAAHPYFVALEAETSIERVMTSAAQLTYWVMAFQDILRLTEATIYDPLLKRMARRHRLEDAGHERWFLSDMASFRIRPPTVVELFGSEHAPARDTAYAVMSELLRAPADELCIVLLVAIESAGHVFFERFARFVERAGHDDRLLYFSRHHLAVEDAHAMWQHDADAMLDALELEPELCLEAIALVDRVFSAFDAMFDGLREELRDARDAAAA